MQQNLFPLSNQGDLKSGGKTTSVFKLFYQPDRWQRKRICLSKTSPEGRHLLLIIYIPQTAFPNLYVPWSMRYQSAGIRMDHVVWFIAGSKNRQKE